MIILACTVVGKSLTNNFTKKGTDGRRRKERQDGRADINQYTPTFSKRVYDRDHFQVYPGYGENYSLSNSFRDSVVKKEHKLVEISSELQCTGKSVCFLCLINCIWLKLVLLEGSSFTICTLAHLLVLLPGASISLAGTHSGIITELTLIKRNDIK